MKIFRSELEVGLENKLFEIPSVSFELDELRFAADTITCTISSEHAMHGFYLKGSLTVPLAETCDRCLIEFKIQNDIEFTVLLTDKKELLNNDEHNILYFTGREDTIEIQPVLAEAIMLEQTLKKLCDENCKGLCPFCGTDKNEAECDCEMDTIDPHWDILKDLTE